MNTYLLRRAMIAATAAYVIVMTALVPDYQRGGRLISGDKGPAEDYVWKDAIRLPTKEEHERCAEGWRERLKRLEAEKPHIGADPFTGMTYYSRKSDLELNLEQCSEPGLYEFPSELSVFLARTIDSVTLPFRFAGAAAFRLTVRDWFIVLGIPGLVWAAGWWTMRVPRARGSANNPPPAPAHAPDTDSRATPPDECDGYVAYRMEKIYTSPGGRTWWKGIHFESIEAARRHIDKVI